METRFLLVAALLAAATSWASRMPGSAPLPGIAQEYDFGMVSQGKVLTQTFLIPNPHPNAVQVTRVECDAQHVSARFNPVIPAGGATDVQVTWDTHDVEGDHEVHAVVHFADSLAPVALTLKAQVVPPLVVFPSRTMSFNLYRGEFARRQVRIRDRDGAPLRLRSLQVEGGHFTVTLLPSARADEAVLALEVPPTTPAGRYAEALLVEAAHPSVPLLRLEVNVLVKEDLYANPEVVDLGHIDLEQLKQLPALESLLTRTLMVRKRDGEFRITHVESSLPFLTIEPPDGPPAGFFRVDLDVNARLLEPGPIEGLIRVHTDDARLPELRLPVVGVVE